MDKGLHKDPPYNLSLNEIATTLDAEMLQEDDNVHDNAIVHRVTRYGARYCREVNDNDQRYAP